MRLLITYTFLASFIISDFTYKKVNVKKVKPRSAKVEVDGLGNAEIYIVDEAYFIVGYFGIESSGMGAYGPQLIVKDKKGKRLFASKPKGEGFVWPPEFFQAKDEASAPIIIMMPDGMEEPTGCNVYMFENGKVKDIGYISAAAKIGYEHVHLSRYTSIECKEGNYIFTFNTDHITRFTHDGSGEPKKVHLDGKKIRYVYDGDKFKFEQL